jgi:autotransporter translocation and assembly factor TamB
MGYFMLVGSNKYLNKMTTYAVGFDVTADIATYAPALASAGARIDDETADNEVEFGHTGGSGPAAYDVATYPTDLADAYVGETWAATMTTTTADAVDWTTNSLLVVCGDVTG